MAPPSRTRNWPSNHPVSLGPEGNGRFEKARRNGVRRSTIAGSGAAASLTQQVAKKQVSGLDVPASGEAHDAGMKQLPIGGEIKSAYRSRSLPAVIRSDAPGWRSVKRGPVRHRQTKWRGTHRVPSIVPHGFVDIRRTQAEPRRSLPSASPASVCAVPTHTSSWLLSMSWQIAVRVTAARRSRSAGATSATSITKLNNGCGCGWLDDTIRTACSEPCKVSLPVGSFAGIEGHAVEVSLQQPEQARPARSFQTALCTYSPRSMLAVVSFVDHVAGQTQSGKSGLLR